MKSVYRWVADHTGLCRFCLFLALGVFTFYAATLEHTSFLSIYLLDLAIWFFAGRLIAMAPIKLMEEPTAICEQQCDPYPLLEEMKSMMARKQNGPQQQLMEINYAMALRMVGENYKCAEILENTHIDRYPGTSPYTKFIYYNNLADVFFCLERTLEAQIWHRKALQIYDDLPEGKLKQQITQAAQLSEAQALYYEKDYDSALRKAAKINCQSRRHLLDTALLAAKCHIALEEPEKAREKLQYIIDNGNKLHIVEESKELLNSLA